MLDVKPKFLFGYKKTQKVFRKTDMFFEIRMGKTKTL